MTIAAILLGAGESTRMGRLKQLLPWAGTTLIAWQVQQLQRAGAGDIVVVLGHAAEEIVPAVPAPARIAVNVSYRTGRAGSLRTGASALLDDVEAVLILSVDQPRPAWLGRALIERWREDRPLIVSPRFAGGFGHPILVDGSLLPELREVRDEALGLRGLIDRHVDRAASISVTQSELALDLNTPADYEAGLASLSTGGWDDGGL
jgi:molybdenum cofactor cytidylyltransferase